MRRRWDDAPPHTVSEDEQRAVADSRVLNAGTEDTPLSNSYVLDGVYWIVNEINGTPGYDVECTFNHGFAIIDRLRLYGHYLGSPIHVVNIDIWDYIGAGWDALVAIPSGAADHLYDLDVSDPKYVSGGASLVRLQHTSPGNPTHDLFVDDLHVATNV